MDKIYTTEKQYLTSLVDQIKKWYLANGAKDREIREIIEIVEKIQKDISFESFDEYIKSKLKLEKAGLIDRIGTKRVVQLSYNEMQKETTPLLSYGISDEKEKEIKANETAALVSETLKESLKTVKVIKTDYSDITESIDNLTQWINYKRQEI